MIDSRPRFARARRTLAAALVWLAMSGASPGVAAPEPYTRVLEALPVTIRYEPRYRRVSDKVAEICQAEIPRIAAELGLARIQPIEIVVTHDARRYRSRGSSELPEWGVAFAILDEQRILVDVERATRAYNSLAEVVPHELSHLLLRQRVTSAAFPIWFNEGLAQWQAREWSLVDAWRLMQDVWTGSAPRLGEVSARYPKGEERAQGAYRLSYAAFTELFAESGFGTLPAFLAEVERAGDFRSAFQSYWGFTVEDYAAYFQDEMEKRYRTNALAFESGPLLAFAAVLFIAVLVRQGIKRRRKYAQLDD